MRGRALPCRLVRGEDERKGRRPQRRNGEMQRWGDRERMGMVSMNEAKALMETGSKYMAFVPWRSKGGHFCTGKPNGVRWGDGSITI